MPVQGMQQIHNDTSLAFRHHGGIYPRTLQSFIVGTLKHIHIGVLDATICLGTVLLPVC
jgi:hypothetical protein